MSAMGGKRAFAPVRRCVPHRRLFSVGNSAVPILAGERVLDGSLIPIRHHYQEQ
jgi:hypothetical protein